MTREQAKREIDSLDYYLQNHTNDYGEESHTAMMMAISALSAEPCREADDYENEIADLHNRLDIAEYDKERYKEEITTLEAKNKGEWIADIDKWGDVVTTVNGYTCSKCGTFNSDKDNFCPNCGADMRGE